MGSSMGPPLSSQAQIQGLRVGCDSQENSSLICTYAELAALHNNVI